MSSCPRCPCSLAHAPYLMLTEGSCWHLDSMGTVPQVCLLIFCLLSVPGSGEFPPGHEPGRCWLLTTPSLEKHEASGWLRPWPTGCGKQHFWVLLSSEASEQDSSPL